MVAFGPPETGQQVGAAFGKIDAQLAGAVFGRRRGAEGFAVEPATSSSSRPPVARLGDRRDDRRDEVGRFRGVVAEQGREISDALSVGVEASPREFLAFGAAQIRGEVERARSGRTRVRFWVRSPGR